MNNRVAVLERAVMQADRPIAEVYDSSQIVSSAGVAHDAFATRRVVVHGDRNYERFGEHAALVVELEQTIEPNGVEKRAYLEIRIPEAFCTGLDRMRNGLAIDSVSYDLVRSLGEALLALSEHPFAHEILDSARVATGE